MHKIATHSFLVPRMHAVSRWLHIHVSEHLPEIPCYTCTHMHPQALNSCVRRRFSPDDRAPRACIWVPLPHRLLVICCTIIFRPTVDSQSAKTFMSACVCSCSCACACACEYQISGFTLTVRHTGCKHLHTFCTQCCRAQNTRSCLSLFACYITCYVSREEDRRGLTWNAYSRIPPGIPHILKSHPRPLRYRNYKP